MERTACGEQGCAGVQEDGESSGEHRALSRHQGRRRPRPFRAGGSLKRAGGHKPAAGNFGRGGESPSLSSCEADAAPHFDQIAVMGLYGKSPTNRRLSGRFCLIIVRENGVVLNGNLLALFQTICSCVVLSVCPGFSL
jgi:hypothetical protein